MSTSGKKAWPKCPSPKHPRPKRPWPKRPTFAGSLRHVQEWKIADCLMSLMLLYIDY